MKFVVFNGSPTAENSSTNVMAQAFLRGAARAGAETEIVHLINHDIGHCRGCFACWFQSPGKCVQQDDMDKLLQTYQTADVVCFATPVYTWNMTAALKNFVDRLTPLKAPTLMEKDGHFDLQDAQVRTQRFVAMANCGFPGSHNFETMRAVFACCNPVLEIYRNCGKLLKSQQPGMAELVTPYLDALEQAGYELALGEVSPETKEALDMPLMSIPEYVKYLGM